MIIQVVSDLVDVPVRIGSSRIGDCSGQYQRYRVDACLDIADLRQCRLRRNAEAVIDQIPILAMAYDRSRLGSSSARRTACSVLSDTPNARVLTSESIG